MANLQKKIFVSVPMSGRTHDEIFNSIWETITKHGNSAFYYYNLDPPEDIEKKAKKSKHPELIYLSWAMEQMADCDDVIFANGWERARGCIVEKIVHGLYFDKEE